MPHLRAHPAVAQAMTWVQRARRALGRVPALTWLIVALAVGSPWYLAYFALVLRATGVVSFWTPER